MVEYKVTKVADTTNSGLCPALDDDDSHFLDGQGNWSEPSTGSVSLDYATFAQTRAYSYAPSTDLTMDAWTKMDLGTSLNNTISGASLASSVITMPAGTYLITAHAFFQCMSASNGAYTAIRLRRTNSTAANYLNEGSSSGYNYDFEVSGTAVVVIPSEASIELQYYCKRSSSPTNIRYCAGSGDSTQGTWNQATVTFLKIA